MKSRRRRFYRRRRIERMQIARIREMLIAQVRANYPGADARVSTFVHGHIMTVEVRAIRRTMPSEIAMEFSL